MKARLLPQHGSCNGNLVWCTEELKGKSNEVHKSLHTLRSLGYWASPFPEGDGVTFTSDPDAPNKTTEDLLSDFKKSFPWISIELAKSKNSNSELAELENANKEYNCIIIVPIRKIYIQNTLTLGKYTYFCDRQFDPSPQERLSDIQGSYLQFECNLKYRELLKINSNTDHNNFIINKCLSQAEYALDIVRYSHSTFKVKAFTPDPAGQCADGFYEVEIIPRAKTHLKPFKLSGIAQPISVSNNWLGPQVDDFYYPGTHFLAEIYAAKISNEITASIISAMRLCRQAFYSIGKESQFLNLIFALDGLANPDKKWTGWKHRTYIAALCCEESPVYFKDILEEYDRLYTDIRNNLVHNGKDFYEIEEDPDILSETIFIHIKSIIQLAHKNNMYTIKQLHSHASSILKQPIFQEIYVEVISRVSKARDKKIEPVHW